MKGKLDLGSLLVSEDRYKRKYNGNCRLDVILCGICLCLYEVSREPCSVLCSGRFVQVQKMTSPWCVLGNKITSLGLVDFPKRTHMSDSGISCVVIFPDSTTHTFTVSVSTNKCVTVDVPKIEVQCN